jgi:hypothetical protein
MHPLRRYRLSKDIGYQAESLGIRLLPWHHSITAANPTEVVVETCVDERNLDELLRHELRWLRTIRAVRPAGHALCFITFGKCCRRGSQRGLALPISAALRVGQCFKMDDVSNGVRALSK